MKIQKILFICLSTLLPTAAMWAAVGDTFKSTSGSVEITYKITSDNTCQVGDGSSIAIAQETEGSISIPDKVTNDGTEFTVTAIGQNAFGGTPKKACTKITAVTMGNNVVELGKNAFYNCSALKTITLSNTLKTLGNSALCKTAIEEIILPGTLETIDAYAFDGTPLKTVAIPANVTTIGDYAFRGVNVTEILIPEKVTSVGKYAFAKCENLKKVTIPNSVTSIGEYNQEIKGETNVEIIPVSA